MVSSIIGGALSLGGALLSSRASNRAAQTQATAADRAANVEEKIYDTTRQDLAPYRQAGYAANDRLSYLLGLSPSGYSSATPSSPSSLGDVIDTSGDTWKPNATLYANDPAYKTEYDRLRAEHASKYGVDPSASHGSSLGAWTSSLSPIYDAYKNTQARTTQTNNAAATTAAQNDPAYGSLTRRFGMSDFQADPGYGFRQSEGNKAIDRSQAARGGFYSGAALKAAERFNSDLASQEYGNAYSRFNTDTNNLYSRLAGTSEAGRGATNTGIQAGQNYAGNVGSIYGQAANASAGNTINQGNIMSQGISGLSALMGSQYGNSSGTGINPRTGLPYSGYWS